MRMMVDAREEARDDDLLQLGIGSVILEVSTNSFIEWSLSVGQEFGEVPSFREEKDFEVLF